MARAVARALSTRSEQRRAESYLPAVPSPSSFLPVNFAAERKDKLQRAEHSKGHNSPSSEERQRIRLAPNFDLNGAADSDTSLNELKLDQLQRANIQISAL